MKRPLIDHDPVEALTEQQQRLIIKNMEELNQVDKLEDFKRDILWEEVAYYVVASAIMGFVAWLIWQAGRAWG